MRAGMAGSDGIVHCRNPREGVLRSKSGAFLLCGWTEAESNATQYGLHDKYLLQEEMKQRQEDALEFQRIQQMAEDATDPKKQRKLARQRQLARKAEEQKRKQKEEKRAQMQQEQRRLWMASFSRSHLSTSYSSDVTAFAERVRANARKFLAAPHSTRNSACTFKRVSKASEHLKTISEETFEQVTAYQEMITTANEKHMTIMDSIQKVNVIAHMAPIKTRIYANPINSKPIGILKPTAESTEKPLLYRVRSGDSLSSTATTSSSEVSLGSSMDCLSRSSTMESLSSAGPLTPPDSPSVSRRNVTFAEKPMIRLFSTGSQMEAKPVIISTQSTLSDDKPVSVTVKSLSASLIKVVKPKTTSGAPKSGAQDKRKMAERKSRQSVKPITRYERLYGRPSAPYTVPVPPPKPSIFVRPFLKKKVPAKNNEWPWWLPA